LSGASPARTHSFVLRLWSEPGGGGEHDELRGEIRHVPSGATAFFRRLEGVPAALRGLLGEVGDEVFTQGES
jgi:hypothetical protein